jgi:hypothetical protein
MFKAPNDALAPATGIINGVLIGAVMWFLIAVGIWLIA